MLRLSGKTGMMIAAASALVGAASWFIGRKYWRDDEEEIEEGIVYDSQGNKFSLEELKRINLDKIKIKCSGVKRELEGDFNGVPYREKQGLLGNEQLEKVLYAAGAFMFKNGGLPTVHKALEDYGDVVERTKWYAFALKAGINPYL